MKLAAVILNIMGEMPRRLQPLHNFDIGMGMPGRGGTVKNIMGSDTGLIIDARGRPLTLPSDANGRRDLLKKWLSALGN